MSEVVEALTNFQTYVRDHITGDEKGEAQVFLDRFFIAFGHKGHKEAGATLEQRIKKNDSKGTSFADLLWKPRVLIEMKKRGEKLQLHYRQAFEYWLNAVPNRPRYVVLCNFDEFWIYDFDRQLNEPVDQVALTDIHTRYPAFNFMWSVERAPIFENDREAVSKRAAHQMAELYKELPREGGDFAVGDPYAQLVPHLAGFLQADFRPSAERNALLLAAIVVLEPPEFRTGREHLQVEASLIGLLVGGVSSRKGTDLQGVKRHFVA